MDYFALQISLAAGLSTKLVFPRADLCVTAPGKRNIHIDLTVTAQAAMHGITLRSRDRNNLSASSAADLADKSWVRP